MLLLYIIKFSISHFCNLKRMEGDLLMRTRRKNASKNTIGGGGRNQSVRIYTTKRQKSRV